MAKKDWEKIADTLIDDFHLKGYLDDELQAFLESKYLPEDSPEELVVIFRLAATSWTGAQMDKLLEELCEYRSSLCEFVATDEHGRMLCQFHCIGETLPEVKEEAIKIMQPDLYKLKRWINSGCNVVEKSEFDLEKYMNEIHDFIQDKCMEYVLDHADSENENSIADAEGDFFEKLRIRLKGEFQI